MKRIAFITLFPDWIRSSLSQSILARAEASGLVEFSVVNPRNYCYDQHRKVDDVPYGGHPGMLIKAEPMALAIESVLSLELGVRSWKKESDEEAAFPSPGSHSFASSPASPSGEASSLVDSFKGSGIDDQRSENQEHYNDSVGVTGSKPGSPPSKDASPDGEAGERPSAETLAEEEGTSEPGEGKERREPTAPDSQLSTPNSPKTAIVITEPSGIPFTQAHAEELAEFDHVIFVCGHYEGIDHRIEETFATHVFSIGDYVLTNGELPALVMADAVTRLVPGVLGNENSLEEESFQNNLLGAPNYTRPEVWRGIPIPDVLKSGNHKQIEKWRIAQAKERTKARRPDMLDKSNE